MIRPDRVTLLTLSLLLAACGGSGDGDPVVPEGTDGTGTEEPDVGEETGGLIDQDSFQLSATIINPGSGNYNGITTEITAYAADRLQNPVTDGTVIYFNAESGQIPASCVTADGSCTVTWTSSGYRPGEEAEDDYDGLERVNEQNVGNNTSAYGLTTILAYAEGEAGFSDSNNNGVFDLGESYESFAEPIRDDNALNTILLDVPSELDVNSNGVPVEEFEDYNLNGMWDPAPDTYRGSRCSDAARSEGHCDSLMFVRDSIVISQSGRDSLDYELYLRDGNSFTPFDGNLDLNDNGIADDSGTFYLFLTDSRGAIPESGTTVGVTGNGYEVLAETGEVDNSVGLMPTSFTGLYSSFGDLFRVSFSPDDTPEDIEITVTSGAGGLTLTIKLTP